MIPLSHVLALSITLFVIGAAGFIFRRNIITVFMCIELMLNAVNLAFIGFSRYLGNLDGQLFVFFVIVVAAAEATVGLAIIIAVYRDRSTLNIDDLDSMKM
jgi:NADH-quinone oxidoreductase subunit K